MLLLLLSSLLAIHAQAGVDTFDVVAAVRKRYFFYNKTFMPDRNESWTGCVCVRESERVRERKSESERARAKQSRRAACVGLV
jgi:hypothetical protein